jgi:hypothetical protein
MKSIITGNKNWVIKVDRKDSEMIHGRPGHFFDGFFQCRLSELSRYDWYYFTKKKDYDNAVAALRAEGIKDANKIYGWG